MKNRVLIADRVYNSLVVGLEEMGFIVEYRPDIDHTDFKREINKYYGVIVNTRNPVRKVSIDAGVKLKFIARLGSGMDIIDVEYAQKNEITVFSAPEGNANAVAEHSLSMLLSLFNNINTADQSVKQFRWEREVHRGREIEGLTVGVIGYGNNGSAFVRKLKCLGVKVCVYDKYKQRYLKESRFMKECATLESLLNESDIISLHIPLTEETQNLVNDDFLEQCKNGLTLINTSRGTIVNLAALLKGFKEGKVYGACLDVLPNEKIDSLSANEREVLRELMTYNTIFTPHIAGWTQESYRKISEVLLQKIGEWQIHG